MQSDARSTRVMLVERLEDALKHHGAVTWNTSRQGPPRRMACMRSTTEPSGRCCCATPLRHARGLGRPAGGAPQASTSMTEAAYCTGSAPRCSATPGIRRRAAAPQQAAPQLKAAPLSHLNEGKQHQPQPSLLNRHHPHSSHPPPGVALPAQRGQAAELAAILGRV